MIVVVVGASDKPHRYSFQAVQLLREKGHRVLPVHPKLTGLLGLPVYSALGDVPGPVDVVTLYVGPERSSLMEKDLLALSPKMVIMNPGAENEDLERALGRARIVVRRACTLVLLRTGAFSV
ncbi:MAG: CoA-binding protein [Elusimicrobia bacterium]|nr:CoA-binding protein [Elusimicrobiota bacterium]